jgi:hypothetical protein
MAEQQQATLSDLEGPVNGEEPTIQAIALPDGARIAFTIQVALEAWAGANVTGSAVGSRPPEAAARTGAPDWATVSTQLYGPRTGIHRLIRTVEERGFRACVSISGLVAEQWPELVAGIARSGHEIVGHGYSQDQPMVGMDEAEDLATVRRSAELIELVTGQRPAGWSSHGSRRGTYTVLSVLKEGYRYISDFRDADIPYVVARLGDRRLLAMTRTDEINDVFVVRNNGNPPSVYVEYFKRAFDQLYAEGRSEPKVMTCVVHATVFGRPWGASALAECLEYVSRHSDVWHATRQEVAEHYLANLP